LLHRLFLLHHDGGEQGQLQICVPLILEESSEEVDRFRILRIGGLTDQLSPALRIGDGKITLLERGKLLDVLWAGRRSRDLLGRERRTIGEINSR